MQATRVTDSLTYHGEGAVWSPAWGGLRFVDMLAGDVLTLDPATGRVTRAGSGSPVAALVRPRRDGGAVIATERGFTLESADGSLTALADVWGDAGIRMNEGGCTPDGALLVGTMAYDHTPGAATVYRLAPDHTVTTVLTGSTISNGIAFSPDGTIMYYVDTLTRRIDRFDYSDGELTYRRAYVEVEGDGYPDGLCVDAEGGVWVALFGGSAVRRYTADGVAALEIALPVAQVTSCTFGGDDLRTLYITTSRENLADDEQPEAGSLFSAVPGVVGLPVLEYAG
ncbi:SMP-30/gluconolactonase/LRE family protein [soil metagenome]